MPASEESLPPAIISFDGEHKFLHAMECVFVHSISDNKDLKGITLIKFAAACSKSQQPCDVSPCFLVLKVVIRRRYVSDVCTDFARRMQDICASLMAGLPSKVQKTYMNFIQSLPELLETAFSTHNIHKGWATAGIFPVNPSTVLGQCPRFKTLTRAQRAKIFASLPSLTALVKEHGQLTDQQIQDAVGSAVNLEELAAVNTDRKPGSKPVHTLTFNRRRALIINHEQVAAQIEEAEARKRGSKAQAVVSSADGV